MQFTFENNIFSVTLSGISRPTGNLREECERKARDVYNENNKVMLGLSGGLDCQIILHSFVTQSLPIKCVFLHMPNCNDFEFANVLLLQKKYNLDLEIVELDPNLLKTQLINEYELTGIPPFQLLHKYFLAKLPQEHTYLQGLDGPDLVKNADTNKWFILQTANSFENSRLRALKTIPRTGKVLSWEKSPEILYSLLTDDVLTGYMFAYDNIVNNSLSFPNDEPITIVCHFDLYIKPILYGIYWKNELEYFHKYQGPEEIPWIMNNKWHRYDKDRVFIPYSEAINILSTPGSSKTYQSTS